MSINLLKRLESSVHSFRLTVDRMRKKIDETIKKINNYELGSEEIELTDIAAGEDFDYDDQNTDFFSVGKKVKIDLADMDYVSWRRELERDAENLELLSLMIADITPKHDTKLQTLFDLIRKKIKHKSKRFAVRIVRLYQYLCEEKREFVLSKQILRSGTSIGANLAEAECAISKKDFLSKIYIALKECSETLYWLELLTETDYLSEQEFKSLNADCDELRRMLSATTKTISSAQQK